jgi:hypothetical protein
VFLGFEGACLVLEGRRLLFCLLLLVRLIGRFFRLRLLGLFFLEVRLVWESLFVPLADGRVLRVSQKRCQKFLAIVLPQDVKKKSFLWCKKCFGSFWFKRRAKLFAVFLVSCDSLFN